MRVLKFNDISNTIKLEPDSFDDLYLLAMIIANGDKVDGRSYRRFKPSEGDLGEQKEVFVRIDVEKVEIDKNSDRLRITGKILSGRPEEFIRMGSYHTLNLAPGDIIEITKREWKNYILKRIKEAVAESKKPKLGVIAMDDEKATLAYIKGYGIEIVSEIYSHLSKKMGEKDFAKQKEAFFIEIIKSIENMKVEIVVIAGPGFTKDDLKKHIENMGVKVSKRIIYASASDAERSGIREVMQSRTVGKLLESEHVKKEFEYLNVFLGGLRFGASFFGIDGVREALGSHRIGVVMINDSSLNDEKMKEILDRVDESGIKIEIFNSEDDAGAQLHGFKDIAAISISLLE